MSSLFEFEMKSTWVAECLDCEWRSDLGGVTPKFAKEAAKKHALDNQHCASAIRTTVYGADGSGK